MFPIAQIVAAISYLWLTITSDIETREFLEVGVLKTLMVSVHGAHYSRPGPLEYLQQNTENTRKQNCFYYNNDEVYLFINCFKKTSGTYSF